LTTLPSLALVTHATGMTHLKVTLPIIFYKSVWVNALLEQ